ncbi:chymotrypsin-1-like [Tetranychus urticae]|uniref:Peptidase S1 domain-containing protein n=1 Tax=Tetranychus urticae TaxID=32264 RepID=T1JRF7_TETUR|nr:chymotrypsin-1-like [Tetranychus urticae]
MIGSAIILMLFLYSNFVSTEFEESTEYYEKIAWGRYVYEEGAYPFYLSIQEPVGGDPKYGYYHSCGGALIEPRIMLTAAHCLMNESDIPLMRVLPNYRNTPLILPRDLVFKIEAYEKHPHFDSVPWLTAKDDIAVVLLDKPDPRPGAIIFRPVLPLHICFPVKIMGYGYTESGDPPYRLKETTVFRLDDEDCLDEAPWLYAPGYSLCVTNAIGSSVCRGDSGGPLIWENPKTNKTFIYGVAVIGFSPCKDTPFSIFVDVLAYNDWIDIAIFRLTIHDELRSGYD